MLAGVDRERVDAVGADDGDRDEEEDQQAHERQAEQGRRRQVGAQASAAADRRRPGAGFGLDGHVLLADSRQAALTSSHSFA